MRRLTLALLLLPMFAGPSLLIANSIPYPSPGTLAPNVPLTAAANGFITLYFVEASSTGAVDTLQFIDLTSGFTSAFFFDNKTTAGDTVSFAVKQGDVLIFNIHNPITGQTLSSNPSLSPDGANHAYVALFAGGNIPGSGKIDFPPGLFLGMEDLLLNTSNLDYNDFAFVLTNAATATKSGPPTLITVPTSVPEPAPLILLATGLVGTANIVRRRLA